MKKISQMLLISISIILGTGCSFIKDTTSNINETTGLDYFKGIYFAKGKVADKIPSIKNSFSYYSINKLEGKEQISLEKEMTNILANIAKDNPTYFKNFKSIIESKNHLKIQKALKEGSDLLYKTALTVYLTKAEQEDFQKYVKNIDLKKFTNSKGEINQEELKNEIIKNYQDSETPQAICIFAGVVFVAAAYVLVVHAAAAMTYVAVAWVAEYYAAVDQEKTVTRGGIHPQITGELLIKDLVKFTPL